MSRSSKALYNIISSLTLQFVTIICGLIIPRLMLKNFGSEVNGLISTISQFLNYIVLLEAGVGGVIKAALYKPLACNNYKKISAIVKATANYFKKISYFLIIYIFLMLIMFPTIINPQFDFFYTSSLIIIIGFSMIIQYFFCITFQILLSADQKDFINNTIQIITILLSTIISFFLIKCGFNIHVVKLGTVFIFLLRPLMTISYVRKHYNIDKNILPDDDAIKQKWDGLGQHIAYFIHSNTDIVVLSIFTNMLIVSVYSIHMSIVSGIKKLCTSLSSGFSPVIGEMIAKKEYDKLQETFGLYEFITFFITFLLFTVTSTMLVPFIKLYTFGITDINYIRPIFAQLLCLSEAIYVIRCIYSSVVMSAGHFKQTNKGAYMEAFINIFLSVILVRWFGLIGVVIGTCISMIYRSLDYIKYLSKNILGRNICFFVKELIVNSLAIIIPILIFYNYVNPFINSWHTWIIGGFITFLATFIFIFLFSIMFYKKNVYDIIKLIKHKFERMIK